MNEEEIIKNIKEIIQWSDHNTYKIALRGILDLYEQEKARNKDLEQIEKEHKEENGRLREKVKKIEEYVKQCDWHNNDVYIGEDILDLLEESD